MQDHLAEVKNRITELRAEALKESKKLFAGYSKQLFDRYPFVTAVGWTQYTPYFNDGDPCTFRSNASYPAFRSIGDVRNEDLYEYDDFPHESSEFWNSKGKYGDKDPSYIEAEEEFTRFLSQFDNDIYEQMFGDHVQCTLTAEGVEVEEYDHD